MQFLNQDELTGAERHLQEEDEYPTPDLMPPLTPPPPMLASNCTVCERNKDAKKPVAKKRKFNRFGF